MTAKLHTLTDKELARAVVDGRRGAFDELYKRHARKLYSYFYKMLYQDTSLAKDCVQECFMKVVENLERYDPNYAFSTWLYTIAYNMCKNHYRKDGHSKKAMEDLTADAQNHWHQPEAHQHDEQLDKQVYSRYLRQAMGELNPEQQQLLSLRFEEELELKDIGQIMGIPEGTVKSRLHYTLKKLATALAPIQHRL